MRKVVLLLSDIDNLETHYLNFAQEYHNAGYDFLLLMLQQILMQVKKHMII